MIDWMHVGELVVSNLVVAAAAYGGIRSDLRNLRERLAGVETRIGAESQRIDNILLKQGH